MMLSLILATGMFVAVAAQLSETDEVHEPMTPIARLWRELVSTDPTQWDAETRKEFFGELPTECHQQYLDAYTKLRDANREYWTARAELFGIVHPLFKEEIEKSIKDHETTRREYQRLHADNPEFLKNYDEDWSKEKKEMLSGDYSNRAAECAHYRETQYLTASCNEFRQYPEWLDPDKKDDFWHALIKETIFLYDKATEGVQKNAESQKRQVALLRQRIDKLTPKDLPNDARHQYYFGHRFESATLPLTDEQKSRILNDEPLFDAISLPDRHGYNGYTQYGRVDFPQFQARKFLSESRVAELWQWRIDTTPELSKLAITQAEVDRWDGSLSLHPFIRDIAWRCKGIDTARLQTTIDHGSTDVKTKSTLSNTHPALMAVIRGEKDVVFSTRRLSQTEKDEVEKSGVELVEVPFAKDAFVFLQNRQNPVRDLTLEQYQGVFSGKYLSWKDVGGFGGVIKPFIRNENSGSEELMQTLVMRNIPVHENFKPVRLVSMDRVFMVLENTPTGIAYSIYHYDRYMMFSHNTRVMAVNGVLPSAETIASGEYPLVYECVLVHRKNPGENVERFVQWLLSDEGQKLVRSIGYVPR